MWNFFGKIVKNIESREVPLAYYFISFFFVVTTRNYLEVFSDGLGLRYLSVFHYYLSYFSVILSMSLILHYASKVAIEKILRIVLASSLIIAMPPILDLLLSGGIGYDISYFVPGEHHDMWRRFFTLFGSFQDSGITPGIRVELIFIVLFSGIYIYYKKRNIIRSILFSFLIYCFLFAYFSLPYLTMVLKIGDFYGFERSMILTYALLLLLLIPWVFWTYSKKHLQVILKDIRPFRLLHYFLMFFVGFWFGHLSYPNFDINIGQFSFVEWLFVFVAITFAWLFSVITNNIVDYKIDSISNISRPLVQNNIDIQEYKKIAIATFFLAAFFGLVLHFVIMYIILVFMGIYWIYSMPPLRLKRVPILSKFAIAANSMLIIAAGHLFLTGKFAQYSFDYLFMFLLFLIPLNFIDIKDYEGDKSEGINTLVTWLGLEKAKYIIGASFLLSWILLSKFMQGNFNFILLIFLGSMQFYFITRTNYKERPIFIIYIVTILIYFLEQIFF